MTPLKKPLIAFNTFFQLTGSKEKLEKDEPTILRIIGTSNLLLKYHQMQI